MLGARLYGLSFNWRESIDDYTRVTLPRGEGGGGRAVKHLCQDFALMSFRLQILWRGARREVYTLGALGLFMYIGEIERAACMLYMLTMLYDYRLFIIAQTRAYMRCILCFFGENDGVNVTDNSVFKRIRLYRYSLYGLASKLQSGIHENKSNV